MVTFSIDGKSVTAQKGETILQVARREGIYIPTMCYISKTTPCASCRMCVVETDKIDGFVLSCNTPPVDGLSVTTNSSDLERERQNIMKLYDVNHPLECGVCDKSGECDLQNKTLEFGVSAQSFSAKDQYRKIEHWGLINYDPALCIMCEKCVHVCNEVIGDDAIELEFGGYKSKVVPKNSDTLDCTFCGECIAVCPVGALVSSSFQYRSNAWELSQVPAICAHCSSGCSLHYEIKHSSDRVDSSSQIYRVTNNFEFATLCGAGRFGFDFNINATKDESQLNSAIEAIKSTKAIRFNSMITNEEAMILQEFKNRFGYKLYNSEAKAYSDFMRAFSLVAGKSSFGGTLEAIKQSDGIIIIGSKIASDNPAVRYAMTTAARHNGAKITYMHPLEDALMQNVVTQFVKYEAGSEEGVVAMLAKTLLEGIELENREFLDNLDVGYLCAESNVGEEEFASIKKSLFRAKRKTLIIGSDILQHERAENIAKIVALIESNSDFSVVVAATSVNSVGVSLICDLDSDDGSDAVGYNADGVFVMGSMGECDLALPALNSQEGTFVNIDYRLLPTNVAVAFDGYTLNDIANALGVEAKYTIDYTAKLPTKRGFKSIAFDDLENFYGRLGEDNRGYMLDIVENEINSHIEDVADLPEFNGTVVYRANPVNQFNNYTAKISRLEDNRALLGSSQFAIAAKISDGDMVKIELDGVSEEREFRVSDELKGTIALIPAYDREFGELNSKYRFEKVKVMKMGSAS